jgi:hypothetical protein
MVSAVGFTNGNFMDGRKSVFLGCQSSTNPYTRLIMKKIYSHPLFSLSVSLSLLVVLQGCYLFCLLKPDQEGTAMMEHLIESFVEDGISDDARLGPD